jgi:dihydroflavonol-4-reductase
MVMSTQKVLVTGASGFLGVHLVEALVQRGYKVRALVQALGPNQDLDLLPVEKIQGSLEDLGSLQRACEGQDAVIHTVGVISYNPAKNALMHKINVVGTQAVCEAALGAGVKRIVVTSSTAAIGYGTDPLAALTEASPFNGYETELAYFTSKYEAERAAFAFCSRDLEVVVVNPGSLMGSRDRRRYEQSYPGLIYKFKPPFLIHGGINFVDVKDAALGHVLALEKGRSGERYILGGENLGFGDLIKRVNKIVGRPTPKHYLPNSIVDMGGLLLKAARGLGFEAHISPEIASRVVRWYLYVDSSKAISELGYTPNFIDSSIERTIRWLRSEGRIT